MLLLQLSWVYIKEITHEVKPPEITDYKYQLYQGVEQPLEAYVKNNQSEFIDLHVNCTLAENVMAL